MGVLALAIILAVVSCLFVWWLIESYLLDAPFLPLPKPVMNNLVDGLGLVPGESFYDLGCGDGRILCALAERNPEVQFIGVEKALVPHILIWLKTSLARKVATNLRFKRADYREVNLTPATLVFLYLWPEAMPELEEKCQAELRPGSRVTVCRFPFPNLKAMRIDTIQHQGQRYDFYHYQF